MNKTHFKKLRNPSYVGSWDLADPQGNFVDKTVTITEVTKDMVFDGKGGQEECVVVKFKEVKPMVCNSTNLRAISKYLNSPYIEDWAGKKVTLTVQKVKAFGEVHDALRVKKAVEQVKQPLPADRFKAALESIKNKTYTKEKLIADFALTADQLKEVQGA
jgi:hypothetical protein